MKFILLISLEVHKKDEWSLLHEMSARERDGKWPFSANDGAIPVGLNAFLFDQTKAHGIYVRVCAHLIDKKWPYFVTTVDRDAILGEALPGSKLQAILDKLKVQNGISVPKVS